MKRVGYLYDKICELENVKTAIKNSTKGKRNKDYVREVYENADKYAVEISEILKAKRYKFGKNTQRVIHDPSAQKDRTITVPRFYPDQIIHWAVMQIVQPVIMRGMYKYCCGSVPKRGGMAVKRKIDSILKSDSKAKYILKLDIKKFFPSVRHDKLKELLARKIKDKDTLGILYAIIDNGGDGLPIGYYTSQWFSNFYLEEIDHYIKQTLHIRHYVRYVDDMVLIDTNKRKLRRARIQLAEFMEREGYGLTIKANWQLWRINSRPLDFVGYRFYKNYTRLRKKLFFRLTRTVRGIQRRGLNIYNARRFNSLIGWTAHINFRHYYTTNIKPIISKRAAKRYIGRYDKKQNREREKKKNDNEAETLRV